MSLETPRVLKQADRVEPSTPKGAPEHDPLQAYRMERLPSTTTTGSPKGFLDMSDLWSTSKDAPFNSPKTTAPARADVAAPAAAGTDVAPGSATGEPAARKPSAAPTTDAAPANHVVGNNESLWKIASDALRANTHEKPSNSEIWKSVKNIVSANQQEHPELQNNPDAINPGMKLNMPEELAAKSETPKAETAKIEGRRAADAKTDAPGEPIKLADSPAGETDKHRTPHDPAEVSRGHHPQKHAPEGEPRHPHHRAERSHEGKEGAEHHSKHHRRHGRGGRRGSRGGRRRQGHDTRQQRRPHRHEQSEMEGEETEKSKLPLSSKPGADRHAGRPDDATNPGANAKPGDKDPEPEGNDNLFSHAFKELGKGLGDLAHKVAGLIHTVGDCAKGPRLTFKELGYDLPPMVATQQGAALEKSGLFKEVPRSEAQPGDYAYRHWNSQVIRAHHGVDKGDAFIVSGVGRNGELYGSNDHRFVVPEDGGRYRNTKFLRPTEEFWKLYGHKA